ncbi:hypothetical protein RQP54_18475 [Curvibacter sp. APW13]|uniref:hypothetical protein n=1 Tax=Curvibacter sp. APW13 TaxID=3077236 RepID=UPI0028DED1B9|nr:hypothetical protein [Curvibacter sp. APW13]MDT8992866.1 hypothetical protein [Curvibacter sp. APW13]
MNTTALNTALHWPGASRNLMRNLGLIVLMALIFVCNADAQVVVGSGGGAGMIGQDAWTSIKGLWFGPAGLALGALIFALSIYFYFKEGVLAVLGVIAMGIIFFFIPGMTAAVQNWARSF